ncbi:MAG: acyl-ACP--UDP-N-acetylglucosamine O-acyltransferase [Phycisphaerales bacterium]|nr:MAG: acyl-ACP--UDP-N-acetylglucosamine O-acyltransferase [Phycisphaerales bacterium]
MPEVHPTAIIRGEVNLADDVTVGPGCVLDGETGPISIGSKTVLMGNVWLSGPLKMGESNRAYPFVCLGFAPQDLKWDPAEPGAGLVIGDGNTFREHVTIHRATSKEKPSRIGNENYWMANSHAGHDATVGHHCILANGTLLAGHAEIADRVIFGGNSTVHQFVRIGRGAMLSGLAGTSQDVPPFFMLTSINVVGSLNLVGLKRSGVERDVIDDVRWVYSTLYRNGRTIKNATELLRERADRPMVKEYIDFIEASQRGICTARPKPSRSGA